MPQLEIFSHSSGVLIENNEITRYQKEIRYRDILDIYIGIKISTGWQKRDRNLHFHLDKPVS